MARFISINRFAELYTSHSELLTEEGINTFKSKLQESKSEAFLGEKNIEERDFNHFVKSLDNPSNLVYHGWASQNNQLLLLLEEGRVKDHFTDRAGHLKHQLGEGYKNFLSPYLSEMLIPFSGEEDMEVLSKAFSFTQLLDSDHCAVVEDQLFKSIQEKLNKIKGKARQFDDEQDLIRLVKPVCTVEIITCVNYLSKSSYALKLAYVDEILNVILTKSCTVRFANWILKEMELIELNKEHEHKIADLRRELKEGELAVRNIGKGRTPIRWKNVIMTFFVLLISVFAIYIIYYKPFSEVEDPQFTNNSSFTQFTKEERKKIDSLLQEMKGNARPEDMIIDQGVPLMGGSSTLTLRKTFDNPTMEGLYDDLIKDADLMESGYIDSCNAEIKYRRLDGVKDLNDNEGNIEAMIKNESEYDVVVFVAENRTGGETYSMFLKIGETKTFKINKYNILMAVPGNDYQNYIPPQNVDSAELPSSDYAYHFCDADVNYKESINTVYQMMYLSTGKTKFMLMGDKGNFFHLIDINGVLEQY